MTALVRPNSRLLAASALELHGVLADYVRGIRHADLIDGKASIALAKAIEDTEVYVVARHIVQMLDQAAEAIPEGFRVTEAMLPTPNCMIDLGTTDGCREVLFAHPATDGFPLVMSARITDEGCEWAARGPELHDPVPQAERAHNFVAAFALFVRQRILLPERHRPDRAERRRQVRAGIPEDAGPLVVKLRAVDRRGSSEPAEGSREWRSRWLVRGHWHNYWEGSGTARVLVPHWLAPYVKGPDGLPVRHVERVFEVSR